MIVAYFLYK